MTLLNFSIETTMINQKNGHLYSNESFDDYNYRSVISFETDPNEYTHNLDIFTTNPDKQEVFELFKTSILKKHPNAFDIKMRIWTTKEQDKLNAIFIEDFLNDNL